MSGADSAAVGASTDTSKIYPKPTYNKLGRNAVEWTHVRYDVWSEDGLWHTIYQDNVPGAPIYLPRYGDIINFQLISGIHHSDPSYELEVKKEKYKKNTGVVVSVSTDINEYNDGRDVTSQSFQVRLVMLSEKEKGLAYFDPVEFHKNYDLSRAHCVSFEDPYDSREGMTLHMRPSLDPGRPGGPI